jgi:small-conductance mechanosensitive channel
MKKLPFILLLFILHPIAAQQITQGGEWVKIAGHSIFRIDQNFGSLRPDERATRSREKIEYLINDPGYQIDSLKSIRFEAYNQIICSDLILTSVTDLDTPGTGMNRVQLTQFRIVQIRNAVIRIRQERSPEIIAKQSLFGLLVVICLIIFLWINNKTFSYLRKKLAHSRTTLGEGIGFKGTKLIRPQIIQAILQRLLRILQSIVTLLLIYFSLPVLFRLFPATRSWGDELIRLILYPINKIITGLIEYMPNLITIVVIGIIFRFLLKILRFFAREIHQERIQIPGFYSDWAFPTYNIIRIPVFAFLFIIIFPYLPGSSSPAFQGVTVFLGLLFSLGSTSAIGNIIAGIVITYMRPFKKGDRISAGETVGYVLEKTLLVTRLRSIKNEYITIPNATLLNSSVINYTQLALKGQLILHTSVTIGYDSPWQKVHELLISAATKTKGTLQSPTPFVLQRALNDFFVTYEINVYCNDTSDLESLYSLLHANIQDAFMEAGMEIMSPHYTSLRDGNSAAIPSNSPTTAQTRGFKITGLNNQ